uniref:C-type lectin domain-containing protein n=1 Tax=Branchiostoma floridae TaxID=7739 RepID=C3ZT60_BRAFL|eukprot:XP_002588255.1 hypothetical protein BRAFLDRAFT_86703 [Branchiostoma floridae]
MVGLITNAMYEPGSTQQPGEQDGETGDGSVATDACNDGPEAHVYNSIDNDDIDNPGQPSGDRGRDDQQDDNDEHTALPNNVQRDPSHLRNNDLYLPADSSSCQVGYIFIERTCVRLGFEETSFHQAKQTCEKEGATLAMPKTKELDVALRNLVHMESQNLNHWIGLKKKKGIRLSNKRWQWVDGSALRNYKEDFCVGTNFLLTIILCEHNRKHTRFFCAT